MKKIKLFALAIMAMLSVNTFAEDLASGGFKLNPLGGGKVEIQNFADDYVFASDGVVTIPATLPNTAGAAFKVVGIANYAFAGLSEDLRLKVKSLKINASVTYIGAEAFYDFGNLASVTFGTESEESNLKWIGNAAFAKDPMLKSISFANCPKLLYFTMNGEEETHTTAEEANAHNAALDGAVHAGDIKEYTLLTADLESHDGVTVYTFGDVYTEVVDEWVFAADTYYTKAGGVYTLLEEDPADHTAVTVYTKEEEDGYSEVEGDWEFAADTYYTAERYTADEAAAYNSTLPEALYAETSYTTPFVYYVENDNGTPENDADDFIELVPNKILTSITLNAGTLDFGLALANIENLATVNIKDTKIRVLNGNALQGNKKITALELPAKPVYDWETAELIGSMAVELKAGALNGTCIQTLTINGNVAENGVEALGVPMTVATGAAPSVPALTTVIFKGNVDANGILAGAFAGNTKLATLTFEGEVENGAVLATSFTDAGKQAAATDGVQLTVTALKAEDGAFAQTTFAGAAGETNYILLKTNKDYADVIVDGTTIYLVKKAVTAPAPDKIYVESNDEKTYYAKFIADANTAISKGLGDVVVYSAYADESNIYMDPLYSIKDKYVVAAGEPVIVRVKGTSALIKSDDKGKYIEAGAATDAPTMRYKDEIVDAHATIFNDIIQNDKIKNQEIIEAAPEGTEAYAVAKISTNGLKWKAISSEGTFFINNAFYIYVKKAAAAGRVNVIWLDENGNVESEVTAIQSIAAKAEAKNGAAYNLAGQKVNAAYKGVIVKDGKKYIQK